MVAPSREKSTTSAISRAYPNVPDATRIGLRSRRRPRVTDRSNIEIRSTFLQWRGARRDSPVAYHYRTPYGFQGAGQPSNVLTGRQRLQSLCQAGHVLLTMPSGQADTQASRAF